MARSAKKVATRKSSRTRDAVRVRFARGEGFLSAHDRLVTVKRSLEAVSAKLNGIAPESLSDEEHEKWSDGMNQTDLAIARVRTALLNGIAEAFEAALPDIQAATGKLESDLAKLKKATVVIETVAAALGVFEKIINLAR